MVMRLFLCALLLAGATACGEDEPPPLTGSQDDLAAAIEGCVAGEGRAPEERYTGMREEEARRAAAEAGWSVRLVGVDGKCRDRDGDLRENRLNLFLDERGEVAWAGRF